MLKSNGYVAVHCAVVSHPHGPPAQWTWSASDAVAAATALLTATRLANPSALSSFKNALADLAAGRVSSGGARRGSATDFHGKSLDPDDDIIQLGMKNDQEGLWPVIFLPHFDLPGNGDA